MSWPLSEVSVLQVHTCRRHFANSYTILVADTGVIVGATMAALVLLLILTVVSTIIGYCYYRMRLKSLNHGG